MVEWSGAMEGVEMITPAFWLNKKVLLTGCTGFKGSWLTIWLHMLGAKVYGYSLPAPTNPSMWDDLHLEDLCVDVCYSDIRDYEELKQYISRVQPEIIIHMAAQPLVKYSYDYPKETYEVNVMGVVNLLDIVRVTQIPCVVINVTTDKCYENKEWVWAYRENEPMGGYDPYSNSKGCSELVTSAFVNSYFNTPNSKVFVGSCRAVNVIGGGDWAADRLIPDIVKSFSNGKPVFVRNPNSIRPWQHVLEPLSGYLTLAESLYNDGQKHVGGWNFGPADNDALTVGEIVEQMCKIWGNGATWVKDEQIHPHEANLLRLDCSKAKMLLNWTPVWNSRTTLEQLTIWYKAYFDKSYMLELTKQQILKYMKEEKC